jgi:plastocyanin
MTVIWSQDGQRPHAMTADDNSFNNQLIRTGATFERRFDVAGRVLYYCELHGGPGQLGMAAEVVAQD